MIYKRDISQKVPVGSKLIFQKKHFGFSGDSGSGGYQARRAIMPQTTMVKPDGSLRPGMMNFAITPAANPTSIVQIKPIAASDFQGFQMRFQRARWVPDIATAQTNCPPVTRGQFIKNLYRSFRSVVCLVKPGRASPR